MTKTKFTVGMKVVPVSKSAGGRTFPCGELKAAKERGQDFLYVSRFTREAGKDAIVLVANEGEHYGNYYLASDLKPYRKFQLGDRVTPIAKTTPGWGDLKDSHNWKEAKANGRNYLTIVDFDEEENAYVCNGRKADPSIGSNGDFFMEADLIAWKAVPKFKKGDKVVPHAKTVYSPLEDSYAWKNAQGLGNGFLYVTGYEGDFVKCAETPTVGADFFNESDLTLYVEKDIEVTIKIAEEKTMKTTTKKLIKSNVGSFYGYIGTKSGYVVDGRELQVGDVIAYKQSGGNIKTTMIVGETGYSADRKNGRTLKHVGLMGWLATPINKLVNEGKVRNIKVVVKAEHLTPEILKYTDSYFIIVEEEVKHMTIEEIQKELGYEIVLEK